MPAPHPSHTHGNKTAGTGAFQHSNPSSSPSAAAFPRAPHSNQPGRPSPPRLSHVGHHRAFSSSTNPPDTAFHHAGITAQRNRLLSGLPPASPLHPKSNQPHLFPSHDFSADQQRITAGENGYYCAFDSFPRADGSLENVVIAGFEGGLSVSKADRGGSRLIGYLQGLPGSVIGAKILDWPLYEDPCAPARPLIAVILHGPVLPGYTKDLAEAENALVDADHDGPEDIIPNTIPQTPFSARSPSAFSVSHPGIPTPGPSLDGLSKFETSVRVYSLSTQRLVSVLYRTPPVCVKNPSPGLTIKPAPEGDLHVHSEGKFVILSSGKSGEVFVFTAFRKPEVTTSEEDSTEDKFEFGCIGKLWTSTHSVEVKVSPPVGSSAEPRSSAEIRFHYGRPLIAASPRLVALCPPSSAQFSLNGTCLVSSLHPNPIGLSDHVNPSQPPPSCDVDMPDSGTFFNWMSSQLTNKAIKGANWITDTGISTLKNYLNKQKNSPQPAADQPFPEIDFFPPNHADSGRDSPLSSNLDNAIVSIYDLNRLLDTSDKAKATRASTPVSTFAAPLGCSLLSFSPQGLHLMTVSLKGTHQFVWDLLHMSAGKVGSKSSTAPASPFVRQIARMVRSTETTILEAVWSNSGDQVMVLSSNGTVHAHKIPRVAFASLVTAPSAPRNASSGSFSWFPTQDSMSSSYSQSASIPVPTMSAAGSRVSTALSWALKPTPWIDSWRRRESSASTTSQPDLGDEFTAKSAPVNQGMGMSILSSGFSGFNPKDTALEVGKWSGRFVASSMDKSIKATSNSIHKIRHDHENKLPLPEQALHLVQNLVSYPTFPSLSSMVWKNASTFSISHGPYHLHGVRKMKWLPGFGKCGHLLVALNGAVHIYPIEQGSPFMQGKTRVERLRIVREKISHALVQLPGSTRALSLSDPVFRAAQDGLSDLELDAQIVGAWWYADPTIPRAPQSRHPLTNVETDICPVVSPFLRRPNVSLMSFPHSETPGAAEWAFGLPMRSLRELSDTAVGNHIVQYDDADFGPYGAGPNEEIEITRFDPSPPLPASRPFGLFFGGSQATKEDSALSPGARSDSKGTQTPEVCLRSPRAGGAVEDLLCDGPTPTRTSAPSLPPAGVSGRNASKPVVPATTQPAVPAPAPAPAPVVPEERCPSPLLGSWDSEDEGDVVPVPHPAPAMVPYRSSSALDSSAGDEMTATPTATKLSSFFAGAHHGDDGVHAPTTPPADYWDDDGGVYDDEVGHEVCNIVTPPMTNPGEEWFEDRSAAGGVSEELEAPSPQPEPPVDHPSDGDVQPGDQKQEDEEVFAPGGVGGAAGEVEELVAQTPPGPAPVQPASVESGKFVEAQNANSTPKKKKKKPRNKNNR